jgi:hypothetical protein
MISRECFQKEWIQRQANEAGSPNPVMLEKAIVALQLLGHLTETGLPLQFKGGTSLLLRISPARRLSIDIDIVTQATPDELTRTLPIVAASFPFIGFDHDVNRDKDMPPKKHFHFFYTSNLSGKTDHILLDVLFESEEALHCEPVPIATPFFVPEREVLVPVPSINSLLGDKLTAFAPNTIGILHDPRRRTDIVKQLFDVAALFDAASDLTTTAEVYEALHAKQLTYRNVRFTLAETLNDTIETGFLYSQLGLRGSTPSDQGQFLEEGVKNLQNHLLNYPFRKEEARVAAGKAAALAAWIQKRPPFSLESMRYNSSNIEELRTQTLGDSWAPLTRLKAANPEAFHYWHLTREILDR